MLHSAEHPPVARTLANGMRAVVQVDRDLPLVALHLCYLAGSRREPAELSGLAHLTEHVATLDPVGDGGDSLTRLVERAGGVANAWTSHDTTEFSATLPAHRLALGLWIEARRMAPRIQCDAGTLEVQRRVVLEERRQRVENRPYGRGFELLHRLLYPVDHPYHRPPVGLPEGLRSVSCDDVTAYRRRCFTPGNAVLALVGDLSPDEALDKVESTFGGGPVVEEGERESLSAAADPPPIGTMRRGVATDRVPTGRTSFAFRAPGRPARGWYAASLLARSLAVGRSSPLKRALVEESQVAQEIHVEAAAMRDASTFALVATAAPGVDPRRLETALIETVDRLVREGLPEEALERARKKSLTDHYAVMQRLALRARFLATMTALADDPHRLSREAELYCTVTPEELSALLRRPEGRAVLSFVPQEARG